MSVFAIIGWAVLAVILAHACGIAPYIRIFHWEEWKGLGGVPEVLALQRAQEIGDEASRWPIAVFNKLFG